MKEGTVTDMYLKMSAGDLIRHYAYLTQAMVHHATSVERLRWSYQQAAEDLKSQKAKAKDTVEKNRESRADN